MMKHLKVIILICFFMSRLYGQVNLQTGSATFSLPMFSWQDDKSRLNGIVALSYNSGNGLRVGDVASNAGQGWSLISGGEIVRMQAGEPDDQVARAGTGVNDITKYPPGILYATVPASNGCPDALTRYPIYPSKNQIYSQLNKIAEDKQLDYFSFQFNGKAGMFVLDPTNIGIAKPLGDTKMKITFLQDANLINQGIRTKITSFKIEDIDGLIYRFTLHGLSKVLKTEYSDENYNYKKTQPKFKDGKVYYQAAFDNGEIINPWIIGSWHLTEIEDALTGRKITFNYTAPRDINNVAGDDITANYTNKNYCVVSHKTSKTKTPEISSVVYPDGHTVTFNYGAARIDLNGAFVVSSVDITYLGRFLSKYELNTSYFILNRFGTPVTDYQKSVARLCLRSVKKTGVDLKEDTPPYIFDYYTGSNTSDDFVPPPFFYAKDIWGFYNGENTRGYYDEVIPLNTTINTIKNTNQLRGLCFRRNTQSGVHLNAKSGYAKNGLLKQIIYPTAGTLTYNYGQNTGVLGGSNVNIGGVHVTQTSSTDGGYSNGCANPIVTNYNYVMNGTGSASSLWGLEMPVNKIESYNHYQPEYKSWHITPSTVPFGECYWHFQHPGIMSQQQSINLAGWQKTMEAISPVLGILSILGTIQDVATVVGGGSPVSLIIDVIVGLTTLGITCIGDQSRETTATIYFNGDLNAAAPLPMQFKRVEVEESPGTIGKTVQEFTSDTDYAIWEPSNPVYSAKQRFASWAYGLPKKTIVYNASGDKVKETVNTYNFSYSKNILNYCAGAGGHGMPCNTSGLNTNMVSCKCEVVKSSSQRNVQWADPATHNPGYLLATDPNIMKVDFYGMYSGRTLLTSTSEKVYKPNGSTQYIENTTSYLYNNGSTNSNYDPYRITTQQSNGDIVDKYISYTGSYSGGAISTLLNNNIVSIPVETITTVTKSGTGIQQYLAESVTEFTQLSNGDIKPFRILEQRFTQPQSGSFTGYQGPGSNITAYKIPQTFSYDAAGNLTGLTDEGGRTVSNIYDYNDKYIIASVINALPATDKSAYSSFETTGLGNWILSGSATYVTTSAITGTNSFTLSSGKSFSVSGLNTAKPYIVSFWSSTSGITVTGGAILVKSVPSYNGFTYYEYDIAQGTSSVTVSGNGNIDELRLYPKTARMRTLTYDPLIGKTSECDENNRITYYEYDNLGRLRFIKDEKKNIVKMHEYNNVSASKQKGCPGTYSNYLISEIFVRNNCGAGYQGDSVVYTVAANTYSSSLSQEDADAQAEHNLLTNGQAYANANGGCKLVYYNDEKSITDTTQNCLPGFIGGLVTYTVPANRYSSIISKADANEKAQDELDANAQAWANDPAHAICIYNSDPEWVWLENGASNCQNVNGQQHRFILQTDVNPNSATYNQTRWFDIGPDSVLCPNGGGCTGEGFAYINGICELGYRINTNSIEISPGLWECIYHYEFSNGSWSQNYYEYNSYPCAL